MSEPVTLFLAGDVMLGRGIDQLFPRSCPPGLHERWVSSALEYVELAERAHGPVPRPVDHARVWGDAVSELERADPDLRIVNLETSVTTSEAYEPKGINYRMHPSNVRCLEVAGVDCAVLANNHLLDWGREGLLQTLDVLDDAGIPTAGAGRDREAAEAPAVLGLSGGRRVVVVAFGFSDSGIPPEWAAGPDRPGVHHLPDFSERSVEAVARIVDGAARAGDVVVASVHWGSNWGYRVPSAHRRFARGLVERGGVHVVHGHSSHHPRGLEVHRGRLVLYGCGDFVNDYEGIGGHEEFRSDLVLMYLPAVDPENGELVRLELVPFRTRKLRLERPPAEDVEWLRDTLEREYGRFGCGVEPTESGRFTLRFSRRR